MPPGVRVPVLAHGQRAQVGEGTGRVLVQYNNNVFIAPWAKTESWTLSVMHTSSDAERFVANVDRTGAMLATVRDRHSELFAVGSVT